MYFWEVPACSSIKNSFINCHWETKNEKYQNETIAILKYKNIKIANIRSIWTANPTWVCFDICKMAIKKKLSHRSWWDSTYESTLYNACAIQMRVTIFSVMLKVAEYTELGEKKTFKRS